ncbi:unnamed protein product [Candida verbasci]|uniref:V-SNARE coiled-coil homology domain-containing protein n=1 Tax=Candida verbasci TaxID=1227364 RepID=A0A9W4TTK5_9ASCO|nr:unnamed protein product [Candida verbasci]
MNSDLQKHIIHCTLTINSTTLYIYESHLISQISELNCSEIISQELGLINSSKTLIGSIPISSSSNIKLSLYFMKKFLVTNDGGRDLITLIVIAQVNVNKTMILNILKNIMDKYIDFKKKHGSEESKKKLIEFKLYMNQIIKFEELNYDSNSHVYNYGSTRDGNGDDESNVGTQINPNQLILANEEVDEVRQLMLDNINKLLSRGDKINLLVDQTDKLNTSSSVFQRKAQQIKRKMWFNKTKWLLSIIGGVLLVLYLFIASQCGFPMFDHCLRN